MAEHLVLIEFAGRALAFGARQIQDAADAALAVFPNQKAIPGPEPLLTADEAAMLANVPKAWLLEAARKGEVPHYRLGKYVRFRLSELADTGRKPTDRKYAGVT